VDIRAITVAISSNKHGLKGYLGRSEIAEVLIRYLTSGNDLASESHEGTRIRCQNPALVSKAIKAASVATLRPIEKKTAQYITMLCDNVVYADFYALAFSLFGYSSFSTHFLYITILAVSCLLFLLRFRKDTLSLAIWLLAVSALFTTSNSGVISATVPSIAANRFLSTLTLVPMLHLVCELISSPSCQRGTAVPLMLLQGIILSFVVLTRSSAMWTIIGMTGVSFWIGLSLWRGSSANEAGFARDPSSVPPARSKTVCSFLPLLVLLVTFAGAKSWEALRIDKIYFTDANLPRHMVWHSAYMGLEIHPEWEHHLPFRELSGKHGDDIPFTVSELILESRGLKSPESPRDEIGIRLHERVIRSAFFDFLSKNKWYAAQLYLFYKPFKTLACLYVLFSSISAGIWALSIISIFLSTIIVRASESARAIAAKVTKIAALLFLFSLIPLFWASPDYYCMADQLWAALFLTVMVATFAISRAMDKVRPRFNAQIAKTGDVQG